VQGVFLMGYVIVWLVVCGLVSGAWCVSEGLCVGLFVYVIVVSAGVA